MSFSLTHRSLARASRTCSRASSRSNSTAGPSTPNPIRIRASLLLSRPPLLTKTPTPLESAYYAHSASIHHAISNPTPESFYFRLGSLPHRRYLQATHKYESSIFGSGLAGDEPDVGDIPAERPVEEISRSHWEEQDSARGERSLERYPEEEVYCLVQAKDGRWGFPACDINEGETFHEKLEANLTGKKGGLDGRTMDSWLVSRNPIAVAKSDDSRTFFFKSHILAGEPKLKAEGEYTSHAWLTPQEIESRLREQGDKELWWSVRGTFGIKAQEDEKEAKESAKAASAALTETTASGSAGASA